MWEDWKFWPDRHVFTPMLKKNVAFGAHKQSKQIYYCPLERFPRGAKDPKKNRTERITRGLSQIPNKASHLHNMHRRPY